MNRKVYYITVNDMAMSIAVFIVDAKINGDRIRISNPKEIATTSEYYSKKVADSIRNHEECGESYTVRRSNIAENLMEAEDLLNSKKDHLIICCEHVVKMTHDDDEKKKKFQQLADEIRGLELEAVEW